MGILVNMFVELVCQSNFFFFEGVFYLEEFVSIVVFYGYEVIVIIDECFVVGIVRVWQEIQFNCLLVKLIIGSLFIFLDLFCIVLICLNKRVYFELCCIIMNV